MYKFDVNYKTGEFETVRTYRGEFLDAFEWLINSDLPDALLDKANQVISEESVQFFFIDEHRWLLISMSTDD